MTMGMQVGCAARGRLATVASMVAGSAVPAVRNPQSSSRLLCRLY